MKTLLKKVGIVAAVSVAALVAVGSLAMADGKKSIHDEQVCSNEATSTSPFGNIPEPLTTMLNGNLRSCETFTQQFPPQLP